MNFNKINKLGGWLVFLISACVYFFTKLFIPGLVQVAARFDLLMINGLSMPMHSGVILFLVLLTASIILLLRYSIKKKKGSVQNFIIFFIYLIIGYSTYSVVIIRSIANPAIDVEFFRPAK